MIIRICAHDIFQANFVRIFYRMMWILILCLSAFLLPTDTATITGHVSKTEEQIGSSEQQGSSETKNLAVSSNSSSEQSTPWFQYLNPGHYVQMPNSTFVLKMVSKCTDPGKLLLTFAFK